MKNTLVLLVVGLLTMGLAWANTPVDPTPVTEAAGTASLDLVDHTTEVPLVISSTMKIVSKSEQFVDEKLNYTIDVKYPQIQGTKLTAGAKSFNDTMEKTVNDEVTQFKKMVALDMPHMKTLPEDLRKNSMHIDYDIDLIKPNNQTIISARLSIEGMQAGRAHPFHSSRVMNFDLATGKALALNDLFKKDANFLPLLAAYSKKALNEKLKKDSWMVAEGTKADAKNFKNWNLQADSILITFDEYQVAPYTYGKQEVEVPYKNLKAVLSAQSPVAECAASSANCQVG